MPEKRKTKASHQNNNLVSAIICIGLAMLVIATIGMCISASIVTKHDLSFQTVGFVSLFVVCITALGSSYIAGKFFPKQSFLTGGLIGLLIFVILVALALLSGQTTFSLHSMILFIALLSSGMIGSNISASALERKRKHH